MRFHTEEPRISAVLPTHHGPRSAAITHRGVLRLALFPSFFYRREQTGELRGVGIEIAAVLAKDLGVRLAPEEHASPPKVVEALGNDTADVALLGIDPVRGTSVDFSPPVLSADFSFLISGHSVVRAIADVDTPGTRIALVRHHAMDTALKVSQAVRVYADTPDQAFDLLQHGKADVLAGIRPGLIAYARRMPGTRLLADCYGRNVIALAVNKGESEWAARVGGFVAHAKADGRLAAAVQASGVEGVVVE
jgi:polar amino acid transport system substrate-binding protein